MLVMIAEIHKDKDGIIHPDDLEVILLDGDGFSIQREDKETGKEVEICVFHERQARELIKAITAMCAALGWKV
tara:strand:+ start:4276 stop:4494 length:219 start_codon:yes stop_codon:yes gene_type:complete